MGRRPGKKGERGGGGGKGAGAYRSGRAAVEDGGDRARHYTTLARDALAVFPQGTMKEALLGVADFCVERAY